MTVKRAVYERDRGCCIFCGRRGSPNAHVLSRAHGGLGVEKNIVTACVECHDRMDNSVYREIYIDAAKRYLAGIYGAWDENEVKYGRKNGGNKKDLQNEQLQEFQEPAGEPARH